jgi:heat shock protein HtpX
MLVQTVVVVFAGLISFVAQFAFQLTSLGGGKDEDRPNPLFIVLGVVAVILAPIAATIIKLAVSREREFLADATGALITRYPEGLASALRKIGGFRQPMQVQNNAIAHLFISDPTGASDVYEDEVEKVSWIAKMFMTHPPVNERIARLMGK